MRILGRFAARLAPLAAIVAATSACDGDAHGLTWRILLPDEAGVRPAAIEARIQRGGCGAGGEVLYRVDLLPTPMMPDAGGGATEAGAVDAGPGPVDAGPGAADAGTGGMDGSVVRVDAGPGMLAPLTPPKLPPGTYGFAATGRDDTCHIVLAGCTQLTLPDGADPATVETNLLAVGGAVLDCPSTRCRGGRCEQVDAGPRPDGATPDGGDASVDAGPPADACVPIAPGTDTCSDGLDGDCDGLIDCADGDCSGDPACDACIGMMCGDCQRCVAGACAADDTVGCAAGGSCHGGSCCTGCWDGTACATGDTSDACGVDGAACTACGCASDTCTAGSCGIGVSVQTIATGSAHACAVDSTGRLWCWGDNASAQLGVGPGVMGADAPRIVDGATDWQQVDAGGTHTCARKTDGTLFCWGANATGQLGIGDRVIRNVPTSVAGTWNQVVAGVGHTCGRRSDGTVACWGGNAFGEAGSPAATDQLSPNAIDGSSTGWTSVAAGSSFSCGVRSGTVLCWGHDANGELGNGVMDGAPHATPTAIMSMNLFMDVAASFEHACALTTSGGISCWGAGADGRLGGGSTAGTATPLVAAVPTGFERVAAGYQHTLAVLAGDLYSWGDNSAGALGDPTTTGRSTAEVVTAPAGTWAELAGGDGFSCGVMANGSAWCWGTDALGQLGNGAAGSSGTPVRVCF